MNKQNITKAILLIATALGGPKAATDAVVDNPEARIEMVCPENAEVGEMVRLSYPGRSVEWILPTDDAVSVDSDTMAVSFREPGRYEVIAAAKVGDSVQVIREYIEVAGKPTPAPDIEPVPEPSPSPSVPTLTQYIYELCKEADAPKDTCRKVAANFIEAASTTSSIETLISKTSQLNRKIDQSGVAEVLAQAEKRFASEYRGLPYLDHQCAWDEVAQGFLKWSNE